MAAQQPPHNVAVFNLIKDYATPSDGAAIANALGLNGVKLAKASEGGLSTAQVLKDLGYLNMHPRSRSQRVRLLQAFKDADALGSVLPQIEDDLDPSPPAQQPVVAQPAAPQPAKAASDARRSEPAADQRRPAPAKVLLVHGARSNDVSASAALSRCLERVLSDRGGSVDQVVVGRLPPAPADGYGLVVGVNVGTEELDRVRVVAPRVEAGVPDMSSPGVFDELGTALRQAVAKLGVDAGAVPETLAWYRGELLSEAAAEEGNETWNRLKLVLLGDGNAGKSELAWALNPRWMPEIDEKSRAPKRTPVASQKEGVELPGTANGADKPKLLWLLRDVPGQVEHFTTNALFFSAVCSVAVVVVRSCWCGLGDGARDEVEHIYSSRCRAGGWGNLVEAQVDRWLSTLNARIAAQEERGEVGAGNGVGALVVVTHEDHWRDHHAHGDDRLNKVGDIVKELAGKYRRVRVPEPPFVLNGRAARIGEDKKQADLVRELRDVLVRQGQVSLGELASKKMPQAVDLLRKWISGKPRELSVMMRDVEFVHCAHAYLQRHRAAKSQPQPGGEHPGEDLANRVRRPDLPPPDVKGESGVRAAASSVSDSAAAPAPASAGPATAGPAAASGPTRVMAALVDLLNSTGDVIVVPGSGKDDSKVIVFMDVAGEVVRQLLDRGSEEQRSILRSFGVVAPLSGVHAVLSDDPKTGFGPKTAFGNPGGLQSLRDLLTSLEVALSLPDEDRLFFPGMARSSWQPTEVWRDQVGEVGPAASLAVGVRRLEAHAGNDPTCVPAGYFSLVSLAVVRLLLKQADRFIATVAWQLASACVSALFVRSARSDIDRAVVVLAHDTSTPRSVALWALSSSQSFADELMVVITRGTEAGICPRFSSLSLREVAPEAASASIDQAELLVAALRGEYVVESVLLQHEKPHADSRPGPKTKSPGQKVNETLQKIAESERRDGPAAAESPNPPSSYTPESYQHKADLLDYVMMASFVNSAPSVCKIHGNSGVIRGSGFVVAPGLLLTARHVVESVLPEAPEAGELNRNRGFLDGELQLHFGAYEPTMDASCEASVPRGARVVYGSTTQGGHFDYCFIAVGDLRAAPRGTSAAPPTLLPELARKPIRRVLPGEFFKRAGKYLTQRIPRPLPVGLLHYPAGVDIELCVTVHNAYVTAVPGTTAARPGLNQAEEQQPPEYPCFFHKAATSGGSSGSPVILMLGGPEGAGLVGIHVGSGDGQDGQVVGRGSVPKNVAVAVDEVVRVLEPFDWLFLLVGMSAEARLQVPAGAPGASHHSRGGPGVAEEEERDKIRVEKVKSWLEKQGDDWGRDKPGWGKLAEAADLGSELVTLWQEFVRTEDLGLPKDADDQSKRAAAAHQEKIRLLQQELDSLLHAQEIPAGP